jgi:hypothetical protein
MTTTEEQENDVDQQRIDELQNQYFREKLATVDAKRLKEAIEFLEHNRRPSGESMERVRPKATASNKRPPDDRQA